MNLQDATPEVSALLIAARAAILQLDGDLFSLKQSMRAGDGKGKLRPFDRRTLSPDDRMWIDGLERKVENLNAALAAFGLSLPNPAGL